MTGTNKVGKQLKWCIKMWINISKVIYTAFRKVAQKIQYSIHVWLLKEPSLMYWRQSNFIPYFKESNPPFPICLRPTCFYKLGSSVLRCKSQILPLHRMKYKSIEAAITKANSNKIQASYTYYLKLHTKINFDWMLKRYFTSITKLVMGFPSCALEVWQEK